MKYAICYMCTIHDTYIRIQITQYESAWLRPRSRGMWIFQGTVFRFMECMQVNNSAIRNTKYVIQILSDPWHTQAGAQFCRTQHKICFTTVVRSLAQAGGHDKRFFGFSHSKAPLSCIEYLVSMNTQIWNGSLSWTGAKLITNHVF